MKWKALAAVAAAMALVVAPLTVGAASAHTGDLDATVTCDTGTGLYTVTYNLQFKDVPTGRVGTTKWYIGGQTWDSTPSVNALDKGPIASSGNQTILLGSHTLPGTTTGNGPWVYAYTTWQDGQSTIKRWSDTRIEGLTGDCKKAEQPKVVTPSLTVTPPTCLAAGSFTKTEEGVNWTFVTNPDGSKTYTAAPKSGYKFAEGATLVWPVPNLDKLPADSKACKPPVVNTCLPGIGALSTDLDDLWGNVDTRTKGHVEYVAGGLHVWTDDNSSQAKVSEGIAANFALKNTGVLDINATANPGNSYPYGPGLNLFVDFDNDGVADGTLVYEEVYGQDLWLTNGSAGFVKTAAPSHTGGNGSDNHGTINEWLSVFPDAKVKGVAYSLGSGVQGDWTITSIVFNCSVYTFDKAVQPPAKPGVSSECTAPGLRTFTHTETAYVWDAATKSWVLGTETVTKKTVDVYDVLCVVAITPEPPVWVDECGPNNGHWQLPTETSGYSYKTWTDGEYKWAALIPKLFDGQYIKPGSQWMFHEKDSGKLCAVVPTVFADVNPTAPTCAADGALPNIAGSFPNVTLAFDRAYTVPGVYTLTATAAAGYTFADGSTTKSRQITVAPKLSATAAACLLVPGEIVSQCVGSVPYLAYDVTLPRGLRREQRQPGDDHVRAPDRPDAELRGHGPAALGQAALARRQRGHAAAVAGLGSQR